MEIERAGRYKDKTNIILKRASQIESWVQDISSDQFLEDDRTKLATYKAFQEIVEACMDIVAKDLAFLREDVLGVLLYGSWATGESHERRATSTSASLPLLRKIRPPSSGALLQQFAMTVRHPDIRTDAPLPEDEGDRTGSCCLL